MLFTLTVRVYELVIKFFKKIRIKKIQLKRDDVIDGSIVGGLRQPILFSFVSNKGPGCKIFCEPETIHYKKINKSVLKNITFYLEVDNNEEIIFNQELLTLTLQMIKNWKYIYTYSKITKKYIITLIRL